MTTPDTASIDYGSKIPNNVGLREDRRLQRALESWQPDFLSWWQTMGPTLPTQDVYLRTAVNVGREGWAHFGHVPMKDYRWGVFLAERDPDRRIAFGQHKGEPAWQKVPGEYRAELRRLIVIQGDTEPASVEQQRNLGATAPSLYDLRNLFQVNVEEGRHLWAMVYLLHAYFGREGREEAEELLHRNSGSEDAPRILGAFNEETPDWLSFFMFTYFTDRDGKYQLGTLKESAFDPLSRTAEFMLKEEAHHMMVGTTGIDRVVERTAQVMVEKDTDEVAALGVIPLPVIQKYLNFHFSVSLDLFGGDTSTNVANYYSAGLKGRWLEERRKDDHVLTNDSIMVDALVDDGAGGPGGGEPGGGEPGGGEPGGGGLSIGHIEVAALTGLNTDLRREYIGDCQSGVNRWNKILEQAGLTQRLALPHAAFNRKVGAFAGIEAAPSGMRISAGEWERRKGEWLPTDTDKTFVRSLMRPVYERGKIAAWIAPPRNGINGKPFDYDYVHLS
jgi:benzoyl-CoA 2,3-dioxygenase component B